MRNLKRALSLMLSSTMVLGMMVMGGSAAGYQDVDDTYHKEAIEVLQAVGIMTGDENGNFNPEKGVTRNEMAVIMSNLMAYNVATYSGTSPFTDVPSWAEPYVAACYTNGITSGTSATTYGGDETVTTAQAALMIMKALGYFQYSSDFGSDWQLATVSQGNKIDLFEKVNSGVKEAMTRNDVAQLVLNGLEAGTVEATTNGSITVGDTTIVSGVKYNYVTSTQDYAKSIDTVKSTSETTDANAYIVELGEKLYMGSLRKDETVNTGGSLTFYEDVFGRPATRWEYQSKEVGVYANEADHAYSNKVTAKTLYDAVGRTAAENYVWTITIDGDEVYQAEGFDALVDNKTDTVKEVIELTLGLDNGTGNGVRTEIFVDAVNGYVHMSLTHYYAAEVYTVDEDNGVTTLADLGNGPAALDDEFDTADFEEDQVVVYSFTKGEIQEVYAATSMDGTVTATRVNTDEKDGDYYIVDGEKYNYNWSVPSEDRLETENVNNDMVGYLDQYGYAIYIDEAAVSYDYAYVLSMGNDGDIYGGNADTYYARLVLTDGTVVKAETDEDDKSLENHIVSYTVDKNGVYTLSDRSSNAIQDIDNIDVDNGIAAFQINGKNYTANSSTVFIIGDSAKDPLDYNNYDFTAYTGVKNMPNITNGTNDKFVIATADNSNVAKVVYVQDADVSGAGDVYFVRANVGAKLVNDSELGRYREIDAVVDGEVVTLKVKEGTTAEEILCGGVSNQVTTLTQLTPAQGLYLNDEGTQRILALESITTNADGLVTNVRLYDARNAQGDGFVNFYAEGTDKATKETVMLGGTEDTTPGTRYAWYDDVAVVRWDTYAGEFKVSTINSVKTDINDRAVAVLADDVLNGLCIVEYKTGATLPTIPQQDVTVDMEDNNFNATFDGLNEGETIKDAQVGDPVQIVIKNATLKSRASGDPVTALEAGVQYSVKINGVDYGPYTVNENNELAFTYNLTAEDIAAGKVVIDGVFTYVEEPVDPSEPITSVAITVTAPTKVGETLAAPTAGTGVVVTGTWAPNATTAVAGENTLTITIAAAEGYTLADNYTVTVNGQAATVTDGKVTVSYTVTEEPTSDLENAPAVTKVTTDEETGKVTAVDVNYYVAAGATNQQKADAVAALLNADANVTPKPYTVVTTDGSNFKAVNVDGEELYTLTATQVFQVSIGGEVVAYAVSGDDAVVENVKDGVTYINGLVSDTAAGTVSWDGKLTVSSVSKDVNLNEASEIKLIGTDLKITAANGEELDSAIAGAASTGKSVYVVPGTELTLTGAATNNGKFAQLMVGGKAQEAVLATDKATEYALTLNASNFVDENGDAIACTVEENAGYKVKFGTNAQPLDQLLALDGSDTFNLAVGPTLAGTYVSTKATDFQKNGPWVEAASGSDDIAFTVALDSSSGTSYKLTVGSDAGDVADLAEDGVVTLASVVKVTFDTNVQSVTAKVGSKDVSVADPTATVYLVEGAVTSLTVTAKDPSDDTTNGHVVLVKVNGSSDAVKVTGSTEQNYDTDGSAVISTAKATYTIQAADEVLDFTIGEDA